LQQLLLLEPAWREFERTWVTLPTADVARSLIGEDVVYAHGPTTRHAGNLLRNLWLAWTTIRRYKPDAMLSTGAALAVPFFLVGRLHGVRLVYVESFTRVSGPGLSGRFVYPIADAYFVQWPQASSWKGATYAGSVL
jgi:UDP-N-acetylglucosamine:LPS N-acetylglucosamine transferase